MTSPVPADLTAAAQWLDAACGDRPVPSLLIVVGIDQGHLLDVLETRGSSAKVLAIEPDRAMAGAFHARSDWHAWRNSGRLAHLVHPDYAGADEAWRMFPNNANDCLLMVNPRLKEGSPEVAAAARTAQKILYGVRANAAARRQFAPRYLTNVIRNVPAITAGRDIRSLTDAYRGIPAVIAAAGPSLDEAIDDLRGVTGRALLIAADTALRPLLDAGIAPQLVAALDPGPLNARHFQSLPECPETWLVAESALDRSATVPFDGRTFWFHVSNHHPWPWLNEIGIDVGRLEVWGSVITAAFQTACLAGCDPIVLVGSDLAYTGGRPYCRGTTYEFDWAWTTSTGKRLEDAWRAHIDANKPCPVSDVHGRQTTSSRSLESFRDWMVSRTKKSGRRVVNATGAGILFGDGVEQGTLAECLSRSIVVPSAAALTTKTPFALGHGHIAGHLRGVQRTLTSSGAGSSPLLQWVEFSGGGFSASTVSASLDEAAKSLETSTPRPLTRPAIPWSQTPDGLLSQSVLRQLPEAMIRFRSALGDGPSVPTPVSSPASPGLLVKALEALGQISDSLTHGDLGWVTGFQADRPASNCFEWPDTTRWRVETFEALLGCAWGQTAANREAWSFVTKPVKHAVTLGTDVSRVGDNGPHAGHACLLLAIEWLRCALSLPGTPESRLSGALHVLTAIERAMRSKNESDGDPTILILHARHEELERSVEIPLPVSRAALARVMTGGFVHDRVTTVDFAGSTSDRLVATISLRSIQPPSCVPESDHAYVPSTVTPLVPSDELPRASVFYENDGCAICVAPHANESVAVRDDGSISVHHRWPRPIVGELTLPNGEVIAWGNGMFDPRNPEMAYVMHKAGFDGSPALEFLPFRPAFGTWWRNRIYWTCFPAVSGDPMGLGSWAPGEYPRLELDDLAVFGVHVGDGSLMLHPGYRAQTGFERRVMTDARQWWPDRSHRLLPLGSDGSASCQSTALGWTATAYPEADVIRFQSADGRTLAMTCYYAFRLAWAGRALVVSTFEREVLLFPNLIDTLEGSGR